MNGAEFRILRESLGITEEWLSDRLGVNLRTIRRWETQEEIGGKPKPFAVEELQRLDELAETMASNVVKAVEVDRKTKNEPPIVFTYRVNRDWVHDNPESLPASFHRAVIRRAMDRADFRVSWHPGMAESP